MSIRKLVFAAMLTALSLTLFIIESMIPSVLPVPGFRIGLAYLPVLFSVYIGGNWSLYDTALILISRILLSALTSGNLTALLFSSAGGILSFTAMALTHRFIKEPWGAFPAGIFSAVMHNIGQISAAALIYTASVFAYLPVLAVASVITGTFIAASVWLIVRKPNKIINKIKNIK